MRYSPGTSLCLAIAAVLAACSDAPTPLQPDLDPVLSASGQPGTLRNAAISRGDTHFSAKLVTHTSVDAGAPAGGEMFAAQAVYERYDERYLEGGYDASGDVHFGVYWDDPVASPVVGSVRSVADQVYMYDRWGGLLASNYFDAFMAQQGLPGGSLLNAFFDDDGGSGGGGGCSPEQVYCDSAPMAAGVGARTTVQESANWKEVRTVLSPASGEVTLAKSQDRAETIRRYRRVSLPSEAAAERRSTWRLEEIEHSAQFATPSGSRSTRSTTRIEYGAWHRNPGRDEARKRAAAQGTAATEPAPARTARPAEALPELTAQASFCDTQTERVDHTVVHGGTPVLWQHGICSGAGTWDGMRPRVSSVLAVGHERAFSLPSRERLEVQTNALEQEVVATGGGQSIVVGHSQGGLIARRFGQRRNDLVRGVITMGTPHAGALIADVGPDYAAERLADAMPDVCFGLVVCEIVSEVAAERVSGAITYGLAGTQVPVIHDVRTGSAFLHDLNTAYEPFLRAGIEVDAGRRWALMRLIGDNRTPRTRLLTGGRPYGQDWVETTTLVYYAGVFLQDLAGFLWWYASAHGGGVGCEYSGYQSYWAPCYDRYYGSYWGTYSYWGTLASILYFIGEKVTSTLDFFDRTWDYLTTRNQDLTDGFIQFSSQRYPSSPGTYQPLRFVIRPPEADSHTGETASPESLIRVGQALELMGVAPR